MAQREKFLNFADHDEFKEIALQESGHAQTYIVVGDKENEKRNYVNLLRKIKNQLYQLRKRKKKCERNKMPTNLINNKIPSQFSISLLTIVIITW